MTFRINILIFLAYAQKWSVFDRPRLRKRAPSVESSSITSTSIHLSHPSHHTAFGEAHLVCDFELPYSNMAEVIIPYEVKRLIYEYLDLDNIKALRQVSSSWAAVGSELLLLPTFGVKSYSVDIPRLISIGSSPGFSPKRPKS